MDGNPQDIRWIPSHPKNFRPGRTSPILGLTVHDMEAAEGANTAEGMASWFQRPDARVGGAHYGCDVNSTVQCVRDGDTAYHAPGVSHCHLGLELAGFARQSAKDWHDPYSWAMLQNEASPLLAAKAKQYGFPLIYLDRHDLVAGRLHGVTTHNEVSQAFHRSTHTDPGPGFPMREFLDMAARGAHLVTPPPAADEFKNGDHGQGVGFLQAMLNIVAPLRINAKGKPGGGHLNINEADPYYGNKTEEAVREFQRFLVVMWELNGKKGKKPSVDGVAGPEVAKGLAYFVPLQLKK